MPHTHTHTPFVSAPISLRYPFFCVGRRCSSHFSFAARLEGFFLSSLLPTCVCAGGSFPCGMAHAVLSWPLDLPSRSWLTHRGLPSSSSSYRRYVRYFCILLFLFFFACVMTSTDSISQANVFPPCPIFTASSPRRLLLLTSQSVGVVTLGDEERYYYCFFAAYNAELSRHRHQLFLSCPSISSFAILFFSSPLSLSFSLF